MNKELKIVLCFRCCPRELFGRDATVSGHSCPEWRIRREEACQRSGWLTRYVHNWTIWAVTLMCRAQDSG